MGQAWFRITQTSGHDRWIMELYCTDYSATRRLSSSFLRAVDLQLQGPFVAAIRWGITHENGAYWSPTNRPWVPHVMHEGKMPLLERRNSGQGVCRTQTGTVLRSCRAQGGLRIPPSAHATKLARAAVGRLLSISSCHASRQCGSYRRYGPRHRSVRFELILPRLEW